MELNIQPASGTGRWPLISASTYNKAKAISAELLELKGFDVLISSTDNRSLKQTIFFLSVPSAALPI